MSTSTRTRKPATDTSPQTDEYVVPFASDDTPTLSLADLAAEQRAALHAEFEAERKASAATRKADREVTRIRNAARTLLTQRLLSDVVSDVIANVPVTEAGANKVPVRNLHGRVEVDGVAFNVRLLVVPAKRK